MKTVYTFWIWIFASSASVFIARGSKLERFSKSLFRPALLVGYSGCVLSGVRIYLHLVLSGNTDSAISLAYIQGFMNPVVHLLLGPTWFACLVELPISNLPYPNITETMPGFRTLGSCR